MNTFNAIVTVVDPATPSPKIPGMFRLRVVETQPQNSHYQSRFMDVNVGEKTPEWIVTLMKAARKGERYNIEGTLNTRKGENGNQYDSINYVTRFVQLASRQDSTGASAKPSGLDDF